MKNSKSEESRKNADPIVVLYDGECPFCVFQMKLLTWLDWLNQLRLAPLTDPVAQEKAPHLTREQLLEAMHCITPDGKIFRGARCIRHLGMKLPILLPIGLILYIPGIIWVAEKIYMLISANRYHISKLFGCKDACAIMPARDRDQNSQHLKS